MKTVIKDIFLKQMFSIQKIYLIFIDGYHFYLKGRKSGNVISLFVAFITKALCCPNKDFKASTKSWITTKNVHSVVQFNQKAQLKPYIDMNTKLRKEAKNDFEDDFLKLMNNSIL